MFALILSVCMAPINASGQEIGPSVCEEITVTERPTMAACLRDMDRNISATKRSIIAPLDWMFSCEKTK